MTQTKEPAQSSHTWLRGRYVVGMDGSEHSQHALRAAITLAELTSATIEVVIAWGYPAFYAPAFVPTAWTLEDDARGILEDAVTAVVGVARPSNVTLVVREGIATAVLTDQSKGADLLILGSRGHGGFAGLLLGSVSSACAEHASCPVLIIHANP